MVATKSVRIGACNENILHDLATRVTLGYMTWQVKENK